MTRAGARPPELNRWRQDAPAHGPGGELMRNSITATVMLFTLYGAGSPLIGGGFVDW